MTKLEHGDEQHGPGAVKQISGCWMATIMVVGLFGGLGIACWLLWTTGELETDVGKAVSELLPFAVVWVGLILGTNQLMKTTAAAAQQPHELVQAAAYRAFLAAWNQLWPTLTTSVSVGYFTAVLADQHRTALIAFVVFLLVVVIGLAFFAQKKVRSDGTLSADDNGKANQALVVRPWLLLAYFIPVLVIAAGTSRL